MAHGHSEWQDGTNTVTLACLGGTCGYIGMLEWHSEHMRVPWVPPSQEGTHVDAGRGRSHLGPDKVLVLLGSTAQ